MLAALVLLHAVSAFTAIHSVLILFMGHGTELVIAGLFIYRAISGRAIIHAAERPLYGIIGFFIAFSDITMAYNLLTNASYREDYLGAKGGDMDMDFSVIADTTCTLIWGQWSWSSLFVASYAWCSASWLFAIWNTCTLPRPRSWLESRRNLSGVKKLDSDTTSVSL